MFPSARPHTALPPLLAALLAFAPPLHAEDARPDPLYDPKPLADDVELPLPCDGRLLLRYVYVLAKSALDDRAVKLGYAFTQDEPGYQQGFVAGQRIGHVNGQFEPADLPAPWRARLDGKLPAGGNGLKPMLYFIGKYEITQRQYQVVMALEPWLHGAASEPPACPAPTAADRLPKVDLSWFDALNFTALYTEWLMRQHRDALPAVDGGAGSAAGGAAAYVRLPTETEWEFAARGGQAVESQALEARLFPRREGNATEDGPLRDWAVFSQLAGGSGQTARLAPIGTKRPNPAGLFDAIGNAAEMVLDPFLLVRGGGRPGGGTGGFVVKGGNYFESEQVLFTGMRREYPLFDEKQGLPSRNITTGFRVALGTLAAPRARYDELFTDWQAEGRLSNVISEMPADADAGVKLDRIVADLQRDMPTSGLPRQLGEVSEELKRSVAQIAQQRRDAAANLIQSSALVAETIGNYNIRLTNLNKQLEEQKAKRNAEGVQFFTNVIADGTNAVQAALSIYLDNVNSGTQYAETLFAEQFQRVQDELGKKPVLGRSLTARATLFQKHVEQYRQTRRLDRERVLNEVLGR